MLKKYEYILKDLDCANCAMKIQNKLSENEHYKNVIVNFNTLRLSLESDLDNIKPDIVKVIAALEPEVEVLDVQNKERIAEEKNSYSRFIRLFIGVIFVFLSFYKQLSSQWQMIFMLMAYGTLLARTMQNAIKLIMKKTIDENLLITISCIGAFLIGERIEGIMVILLYEIGKILEEKAIHHTRKSIANLMDIRPEYANIKIKEEIKKVIPSEVNIDDIVVIKKGEKIPLDGIVVKGEASLNVASLTGESKLKKVHIGEKVLSGSINEDGIIEVKVIEKYENSTVHKILALVENATDKKAKTETIVSKGAKIYTPIVIGLAVVVAIVLPLISSLTYQESIYRALIFLVVSCPCAIAISVPLSYFSGIGRASKAGILIKGSNFLDALQEVKTIIFDKTGTLTKGEFGIETIKVYHSDYTKEQVLEMAAWGENFSNHPIAKCIIKQYGKTVDVTKVKEFTEIAGKGIMYHLDDKTVKIGNRDFVGYENEEAIGTNIFIKVNDDIIGCLVLNDILKEDAPQLVKHLHQFGIHTKMFTGDEKLMAQKVGEELGIEEVKYEMLPQDKYQEVEKVIQNHKKEEKVAFVGDGINDAPVLTLADIGISMGGVGASAAIEASDIVIMTDNLTKIEEAIDIARQTVKIIQENLLFAISIKILVLCLSVLGMAQMWQAIFADVGVTLLTIINTIRVLKYKIERKKHSQ